MNFAHLKLTTLLIVTMVYKSYIITKIFIFVYIKIILSQYQICNTIFFYFHHIVLNKAFLNIHKIAEYLLQKERSN